MFSNKVGKTVQELLSGKGFPIYYIDQIPSFDNIKNPNGFVGWDIEEIRSMHCTEGLAYAYDQIVLNFELAITVYNESLSKRNEIEKIVMDVLQPVSQDTGRRTQLKSLQLTNSFVRHIIWISTTEFPIQKTAQSNAEMSASVLLFNSSISIEE